jgi:hypothetical protein
MMDMHPSVAVAALTVVIDERAPSFVACVDRMLFLGREGRPFAESNSRPLRIRVGAGTVAIRPPKVSIWRAGINFRQQSDDAINDEYQVGDAQSDRSH